MPPDRGLRIKQRNHHGTISPKVFDVITISDTSDSSVAMAKKRTVARKGKGKAPAPNLVPNVYQEMLAEALPVRSGTPERPLKRRRTDRQNDLPSPNSSKQPIDLESHDTEDDEDDIQFEDVLASEEQNGADAESLDDDPIASPNQSQTAYMDSGDESEDSDFEWESANLAQGDEPIGDLELTLVTKPAPQRQAVALRRNVVTKAERELRLQTHKLHVLCLLSYVDRRNAWCNDSGVQESLKALVNNKTLTFLRPKSTLSQFGRAESLKRGLEDLSRMWRAKFNITARGIRRSLWAEAKQDLHNVCFPSWLLSRMQVLT
jgi:xeroderma pigmentosum group C-complementing protein